MSFELRISNCGPVIGRRITSHVESLPRAVELGYVVPPFVARATRSTREQIVSTIRTIGEPSWGMRNVARGFLVCQVQAR